MLFDSLEMRYSAGRAFAITLCSRGEQSLSERLTTAIGDRRALLCTTPSVARLHRGTLDAIARRLGDAAELIVLEVTEADKHIETVLDLCARAKRFGIGRRDVLVAIGGGVCSDLVRMASSLIRRGVPHLCVPTTLIGQIDAGIGIKGAVNFSGGKSYLGCFHAPEGALIDPAFLATLPVENWRNGFAEAVKLACVADAGLLAALARLAPLLGAGELPRLNDSLVAMVWRSVEITVQELTLDPLERGELCRLLDFGHSFSPAIESASDYTIAHGEAVAIDMCLSAEIAVMLGLLAKRDAHDIIDIVAASGLPISCPVLTTALMRRAINMALQHRAGNLNLVVPVALGRCAFIRDAAILSDAVLEQALGRLNARAAAQSLKSSGSAGNTPPMLKSITTMRTISSP
jgi:3-dehydroquinate synthase